MSAIEDCVRLERHDCPGQILCWKAVCRECDVTLLPHLPMDGMHPRLYGAVHQHAAATGCPCIDTSSDPQDRSVSAGVPLD